MEVKFNYEANTANGFFITDSETGRPMEDVKCPVACGACCGRWYEARELAYLIEEGKSRARCPMLRRGGCKLKRSRMPKICKLYLCELGLLVANNQATLEEAKKVVEEGAQGFACSWLGRALRAEFRTTVDIDRVIPALKMYQQARGK